MAVETVVDRNEANPADTRLVLQVALASKKILRRMNCAEVQAQMRSYLM